MRAILKGLHSPDVDDLPSYQPEDENLFAFLLQAFVGPNDAEGEESFDIWVCTPEWLCKTHAKEDVVIGRGLLIVREYNYNNLLKCISNFCEKSEGETWKELAGSFSRIGRWEFEEYRDAS